MATLEKERTPLSPVREVNGVPDTRERAGPGSGHPTQGDAQPAGGGQLPLDLAEKGAFLNAAVAAIRKHLGMDVFFSRGGKPETFTSGSHIDVPILLKDGTAYGVLCSYGARRDLSPHERDLGLLRIFAEMAAERVERERKATQARYDATQRIRSLLRGDHLKIVYQPIFDLRSNSVAGYEALSRITAEPVRAPDVWFEEAGEVGLAAELEFKVIRAARANFADRAPPDCYLSLNVSPATLLTGQVEGLLAEHGLHNVQIEVTEHEEIADYQALLKILQPMRDHGIRIAVDDFGSGYASFRHVLGLSPAVMKLDISIVRNIDRHQPQRAVAAALIAFAKETGGEIIAEGVETTEELATLRVLGICKAQGYYLGRPGPLPG